MLWTAVYDAVYDAIYVINGPINDIDIIGSSPIKWTRLQNWDKGHS